MEHLVANLSSPKFRRATYRGKEHIVVPVRMIVPGVLSGSKGPLYYPSDEIARNYKQWNGIPITVGHPTDIQGRSISANTPGVLDKVGVGVIRNPRIDNNGLAAEAWIDAEKANRVDKSILKNVFKRKPGEVSTGLYTDNEEAQAGANYKGKSYTHIARNYSADHLAILPNQVGACSNQDGCGLMLNRRQTVNGGPGSGRKPEGGSEDQKERALENPHRAALISREANKLSKGAKTPEQHEAAYHAHSRAADIHARIRDNVISDKKQQRHADAVDHHVSMMEMHMRGESPANNQLDPWYVANEDVEVEEENEVVDNEELVKNAWSEEARAASAEARKASDKAHVLSKAANNRRASLHSKAAKSSADIAEKFSSHQPKTESDRLMKHENAANNHQNAADYHGKAEFIHEGSVSSKHIESANAHKEAAKLHRTAAVLHDRALHNDKSVTNENVENGGPGSGPHPGYSVEQNTTRAGHGNDHKIIHIESGKHIGNISQYNKKWNAVTLRQGDNPTKLSVHDSKDEAIQAVIERHKSQTNNRDWSQAKRDKTPAKDFAGPDESFPIQTQADVDAASHLVGKAADPEAVKSRIISIAKKRGLTVPKDWVSTHHANAKSVSRPSRTTNGRSGLNNVSNKESQTMAKLTEEDREVLVNQLVENCECEDEREVFNSLSDEALTKLSTLNAKKKDDENDEEAEEGEEDMETNQLRKPAKKQPIANSSSEPPTVEAWMKSAPPEIQTIVANAIRQEQDTKKELIKKITANYSKEEREIEIPKLAKLDNDSLKLIANKVAAPKQPQQVFNRRAPLFVGSDSYPVEVNNQGEEVETGLDLPTINWAEWAKEDNEKPVTNGHRR